MPLLTKSNGKVGYCNWKTTLEFVFCILAATFIWKVTEAEAYTSTDSIGFPDAERSSGAPIPITRLGDTRYFIYRHSTKWSRAAEICTSHQRKLATFPREQDYEDIVGHLFNISKKNITAEFRINRRYWIGLNDLQKEDVWQWNNETDSVEVNKWTRGTQPLKGRNSLHCVMLWNPLRNQHMWKEEDCNNKYYFVCENNST